MYAKVLVEIESKSVDKMFCYKVPSIYQEKIEVGERVRVSFGSRTIEGFVMELTDICDTEKEIKEIISLVDDMPLFNEEMLLVGKKISQMTLCPLIQAYQSMLPKALKASVKTNISIKKNRYLVLNISEEEALLFLENNRFEKQKEIIRTLLKEKKLEISSLSSSVHTLIKHNIVKIEYEETYRYQYENKELDKKIKLNEEQEKAVLEVTTHLCSSSTYLLYGVTGSGKTEVYMHIIKKVRDLGKTALMLVPEISLTTQMIARLKMRFGDDVAVLHSALSDTEKYDEYRKIKNEKVHIVVGARSAVFAPLKNIGIIIMDEEHVSTYKQDTSPRYHAKDVAQMRSLYHKCPLLLGSATPSLESYARALKGVYHLLELKTRANQKALPTITCIDMKKEFRKKNVIFSSLLKEKIQDRLQKKDQIILLLNRRGYSPLLSCPSCGYVVKCPNCDVTLTYHKTSSMLRCHYCGYATSFPKECPHCHEHALKDFGLGTEKVEEELIQLFPQARILRMDLDTTSKKGSHEKMIRAFSEHQYDILVGTQMISKGLDFPLVTLVGVLNADMSLNIPDFRSSERTFQLLCQVSGRSGRSDKEGEVIIQAMNCDHYSIRYAQKHDYVGFFQEEMNIRKILKYSPYYFITLVKIASKDYLLGMEEARKVSSYLKNHCDEKTIILGPTPCNVLKIKNIYYFQCIIKYKKDENLMHTLKFLDDKYKNDNKINIFVDIDPLRL